MAVRFEEVKWNYRGKERTIVFLERLDVWWRGIDPETMKEAKYKGPMKDTGIINEMVKEHYLKNQQDKHEFEQKVMNMQPGEKFIGNDNKTYEFVKKNRTRFTMKDSRGVEYTAAPGFVKMFMEEKIVRLTDKEIKTIVTSLQLCDVAEYLTNAERDELLSKLKDVK